MILQGKALLSTTTITLDRRIMVLAEVKQVEYFQNDDKFPDFLSLSNYNNKNEEKFKFTANMKFHFLFNI